MKKWKCVCGYIHDGDEAPVKCHKCGESADKFTALDDKAANLVERSRHTNALHCRLVNLGRQTEQACKDGIEEGAGPQLRDHEAGDDRDAGAHRQRQMGLAARAPCGISQVIGESWWGKGWRFQKLGDRMRRAEWENAVSQKHETNHKKRARTRQGRRWACDTDGRPWISNRRADPRPEGGG